MLIVVERLTLTVLVDNEPNHGLKNTWGWSVLLESERWRILFDADSDPSVLKYNVEKLKIDLSLLDMAFLSHYHGDHYGGFQYVGRVKPNLKVYVPPGDSSFLEDWNLTPIILDRSMKLNDDLCVSGPMGFIGEQALGVRVLGLGLIVIVGCSHPGVDTLTERLKQICDLDVHLVIGGYHSPSRRSLDALAHMAEHISPAHCSGSHAKEYVKKHYPEKYYPVRTGMKMTLKAS